MSVHSSAYFWNGDTLVLHIFLQPRASQNEWAGRHNGRIRLHVTAAPVDNQANRESVKFISKNRLVIPSCCLVIVIHSLNRGKNDDFLALEQTKILPSWRSVD